MKRPHTLADHLLGALAGHSHDGEPDHDHDHDHDGDGGDAATGPAGERVVLTSLGIDIGSSGTQLAFSRLALEDGGGGRQSAGRRETIYQSPVAMTPFVAGSDRIDEAALGSIVDRAFSSAGLTADDVDCGVVILTGAARERANAEAIGRRLAETCGDIVSASAGHHMEARLAAHGSGAVARSASAGNRLLVIDIGGATTKLAIVDAGHIAATAALAIGGRVMATDAAGTIVRLDSSGERAAARAGLQWQIGLRAGEADMQRLGAMMADDLVAALTVRPMPPAVAELCLTPPLVDMGHLDGIVVSGGVGEYVNGRERRWFGDLGLPLGRALAARIDAGALPWPLLPADECIRATVLGAAGWSVQLSGRTGHISAPGRLLPRRNVPVIAVESIGEGDIEPAAIAARIAQALAARDIDLACPDVVVALAWRGLPEHARLRALAEGVTRGLAERIAAGLPVQVIVDGDIAGLLGAILAHEIGLVIDVMVLDCLVLGELDFVDLGRLRLPSCGVPVTIKTLVFRDKPLQKRRRGTRRRRSGNR